MSSIRVNRESADAVNVSQPHLIPPYMEAAGPTQILRSYRFGVKADQRVRDMEVEVRLRGGPPSSPQSGH